MVVGLPLPRARDPPLLEAELKGLLLLPRARQLPCVGLSLKDGDDMGETEKDEDRRIAVGSKLL